MSSDFVSSIMLPNFNLMIELYEAKEFSDCLIMLLPLLEHMLRCMFGSCNNCEFRIMTAESSEFYTTLDNVG